MDTDARKRIVRTKKIMVWYNQILNFFWSILSFVPLVCFCYQAMNKQWIILFAVSSLSAGFLPNSFFRLMQLGKTPAVYQKIRIRFVKKFTQDGDLINNLIRRKHPGYTILEKGRPVQYYVNQTTCMKNFIA